ncbi:hypothetical protein BCF74_11669 [Knoellia remsis]|uniref:DUF4352 domain-containing protein n=1 Tax=Knoellia remsis TaxID=407159 RepID=A0A2T0UH50_9MICO|nr:hypothetical protein [Knoellia remsis]PRY57147.1 hypothetical protein BCF74_11669 [Knoellia remsis]
MGESSTTARGVIGRARDFVTGRPTSQKVGGGVAAALLATAPFGGLSRVPEPAPDPIRLGEPIEIGPYRVTIDQVVELPDLEPAVRPGPDQRVIVLDATVKNTSDRPDYAVLLLDQLSISGGGTVTDDNKDGASDDPTAVVVADATRVSVVNPGVEYRLALTFVTEGPWDGDTVTVRANRLEFVAEDPLTLDNDTWRDRGGTPYEGALALKRRS